MKQSILIKSVKIISAMMITALMLSICSVGFSALASVSSASKISDYSCNFEDGGYDVTQKSVGGSIVKENDESILKMSVLTKEDKYQFEVFDSQKGSMTLKNGNFYSITAKFRVDNVSGITATSSGTTINVGRYNPVTKEFVEIKGFNGVFLSPGDTTDWQTVTTSFKVTISSKPEANVLAIKVTSPSCASNEDIGQNNYTCVMFDDISVYECTGSTSVVEFITNGGEFCEPILAQPGEAITVPEAKKDCYDFAGWYTDIALTKKFYGKTMSSSMITKLYAKWKISSSAITIQYETNGGQPIETTAGRAGETVVIPAATRDRFAFDGWYTDKNLKNKFTGTTLPDKSITLYAKWKPIPAYCNFENTTVFGEPNDRGVSKRMNLTTDDKYSGKQSLFYNFEQGSSKGWGALAGVQIIDEHNEKYPTEKGKTYKITFKYKVIEVTKDANWFGVVLSQEAGCWVDRTPVVESGSAGALSYDASDVGKGWQTGELVFTSKFTAQNAGYVALGISGHSKLYVDDIIIYEYAQGRDFDGKAFVEFDTKGGSAIEFALGDLGEKIPEPQNPTKDGYRFSGWYLDEGLSKAYIDWKFDSMYTKLYASWTKILDGEQEQEQDPSSQPVESAPTQDPDTNVNADTDTDNDSDYLLWIIIGAAILVVIAAAAVIIVVVLKKKKANVGVVADADKEPEIASEAESSDTKDDTK